MFLAQEAFATLVVDIGGQHLHRDDPVERALYAPVDDAEAAVPDLARARQAHGLEFVLDGDGIVLLGVAVFWPGTGVAVAGDGRPGGGAGFVGSTGYRVRAGGGIGFGRFRVGLGLGAR